MMLQLVVLLAVLSVAFGGVSTAKTVSASIKDANVEGLEGLNLKINVPFKVEDYTVGVRHTFGNSLKSGPEAVFVKRTFDTSQGSVAVDVEYETANNVFNVATKWVSDKLHLTLGLEGSSNDKIKSVEIANSEDVKGSKVDTKLTYDVLSRKISGESSVERDDTRVKLTYDTEEKDPVLEVTQQLDESNSVTPSISLKDGKLKYGYTRKWEGGSLDSTLYPGDKVTVEWSDNSATGVWKTKATVPINDVKGSKVSVTRDWKY